jgi:hypothetical protein
VRPNRVALPHWCGGLPFTGSNPLPMLIGALVLVLGGGGLLLAGRLRGRQVK